MKEENTTSTLNEDSKLVLERKRGLWLFSNNFLKRAFSILGHNFVAGMIVYVAFLLLFLLIMAIAS